MNKKALFAGTIVLLLAFAILPAANAVVLDPSGCPAGNSTAVLKLYKEYNSTYNQCYYHGPPLILGSLLKKYNLTIKISTPNNIRISISKLDNILEHKPISNLTWNEAYYMARRYSSSNGGKSYSTSKYNKVVECVNQMISVQNTPQSRALAYIEMSAAAGSMYGLTNNPKWLEKNEYFIVMSLQNNPSGIVNDGISPLNSTWWDGAGLSSFKSWGYNVPQPAIDFVNKALRAARAGKLNTQAQLKEIGFYQWKKKYLIPIVNEKTPKKIIVPTKGTTSTQLSGILNFIFKHGSDLAKGIGGIFIFSIVLLLVRRRRNRYYY